MMKMTTPATVAMTSISRLRKTILPRYSYYDRVDYDAVDNRSFFIYDLSRYNNRTYYAYGVTDDIYNTELVLKRTVPVYKLIYYELVSDNHRNVATFEEFILSYKSQLPLLDKRIDTFTLDDDTKIEEVVDKLGNLFSSHV